MYFTLPGHGAGGGNRSRDLVPEQDVYLRGRDSSGEVDTHEAFRAWCEVHDGGVDRAE